MLMSNKHVVPEATAHERVLNYAEFQLFQVKSTLSDFYENNESKFKYFHLVNLKNKLEAEIKELKSTGAQSK